MEVKVKWRFNVSRIQKAAKELGISHEITIKKVNDHACYAGCYMWYEDRHNIEIVKSWCGNADYASEVIWHELTHALQDERMGRSGFKVEYNDQRDSVLRGWDPSNPLDIWAKRIGTMPLEQEAIENQARAKEFPLVYVYGKDKV